MRGGEESAGLPPPPPGKAAAASQVRTRSREKEAGGKKGRNPPSLSLQVSLLPLPILISQQPASPETPSPSPLFGGAIIFFPPPPPALSGSLTNQASSFSSSSPHSGRKGENRDRSSGAGVDHRPPFFYPLRPPPQPCLSVLTTEIGPSSSSSSSSSSSVSFPSHTSVNRRRPRTFFIQSLPLQFLSDRRPTDGRTSSLPPPPSDSKIPLCGHSTVKLEDRGKDLFFFIFPSYSLHLFLFFLLPLPPPALVAESIREVGREERS